MFTKELVQSGRIRRFTIQEASGDGWEVREEEDSRVLRRTRYADWHRVERALGEVLQKVATLEEQGWRVPADGHVRPS
jgi:hypothetical protein